MRFYRHKRAEIKGEALDEISLGGYSKYLLFTNIIKVITSVTVIGWNMCYALGETRNSYGILIGDQHVGEANIVL
jgi:hypothetical protein